MKKNFEDFKPGDTVAVTQKIKEGETERLQTFTGVVIARRGKNPPTSFTVRKVSYGVEIEKNFPWDLPTIESVKVVSRGRVRRAKLYYLRGRKGRAAKIRAAK
ncbi:MAG: 50S ribosomal protein L19 [Elusimicrobia bacterium]|nr:50S ribosomal protein L19 [Elusimicrobiota bacterium]